MHPKLQDTPLIQEPSKTQAPKLHHAPPVQAPSKTHTPPIQAPSKTHTPQTRVVPPIQKLAQTHAPQTQVQTYPNTCLDPPLLSTWPSPSAPQDDQSTCPWTLHGQHLGCPVPTLQTLLVLFQQLPSTGVPIQLVVTMSQPLPTAGSLQGQAWAHQEACATDTKHPRSTRGPLQSGHLMASLGGNHPARDSASTVTQPQEDSRSGQTSDLECAIWLSSLPAALEVASDLSGRVLGPQEQSGWLKEPEGTHGVGGAQRGETSLAASSPPGPRTKSVGAEA